MTDQKTENGEAGRPPFVPTLVHREWVKKCAEIGLPQEVIVLQIINPESDLAITVKTLRKHFRKELDFGLGTYGFTLMEMANKVATNPDHDQFSRMNIWAQKTRLGMKEITVNEIVGADGVALEVPSLVIIKGSHASQSDPK